MINFDFDHLKNIKTEHIDHLKNKFLHLKKYLICQNSTLNDLCIIKAEQLGNMWFNSDKSEELIKNIL